MKLPASSLPSILAWFPMASCLTCHRVIVLVRLWLINPFEQVPYDPSDHDRELACFMRGLRPMFVVSRYGQPHVCPGPFETHTAVPASFPPRVMRQRPRV